MNKKFIRLLFLSALTTLLSACGGGGGGSSTTDNVDANAPDIPITPDNDSAPEENEDGNQNQTYSINLNWAIPDARENGKRLELYEIGGYEIQYKLTDDSVYTSIVIDNNSAQSYEITNLIAGNYEIRMASFDTAETYSNFTNPLSTSIGS